MANIKISELNPLLTVEDADVLPIVDNAVTKKVTAAILRSYTQGNSVLLTGAQTVAGIKTFTSQLASTVATGTAPFSVASTTKVTNLNADLLDGLSSADFQATLSGTGIVKSTAGTISYLTDNTANWDTAYNDKINSAAVTGSGTNTLTLTQQDAGTITATWVNGTLIREVRNTTGATLTKGTIVYISGATGNKPTVTKAIASGDSTSAQTFGFIQSDLANNANGYVVVVGDLTGVDTSAFAEGDQLYLSSTVAGAFTDVKQYAPAHLVYVGIVTRSHPTLGQIEVNIQNGYELDELHNVSAQSPSNGDILQFVTSTGLWTKVAGTTTNISEGTNLYFTNARSRSAFSESVTGLDYNSTTGVLSTTSGYGIPTTASQATWDTAYNDSIVSAAVTGTTTKTLTLNQQDGGTVTASWTDDNTDAVSSVFGRTGAVVAASGDYTTTQVTEGTNLYFTDARARAAISLTTTGTSGAATYSGGVLNIPQYQAALTNPITGTGTAGYISRFSGSTIIGDSLIFSDGVNVGIGTTTPAANLHVKSSSAYAGIRVDNTGTTGGGFFAAYQNGSQIGIMGATGAVLGDTTSNLAIFSETGKSIDFMTDGSGTTKMRITSGGNVLIGTTTDAGYKLDVNGTARVSDVLSLGTNTNYILFGTNTAVNPYIQGGSDNSLFIGTGNASRLTISPSGAATFSSSVTANGTGGSPALNIKATDTNFALASILGNQTGDVSWLLMSGYPNAGDFTIRQSDTIDALTIKKTTGAATFSSSVGIGATPLAPLQVKGPTSLPENAFYLTNSTYSFGSTGSIIRMGHIATSGNAIGILENLKNGGTSGETLAINAIGGNVLIGTTTDAGYKLDVSGIARATSLFVPQTISTTSNAESSGSLRFNYATNANSRTWRLANDIDAYGDFAIQQSTTQTGSTFANKLIFSPSGEATFSSSVTATKANLYNNAEQLRIAYDNSGSVYTDFRSDSGGGLLINTSGSYIINYLAGVEKMRIKPNTINFASIPTSASGLSAGDIWNDGGTLKIV